MSISQLFPDEGPTLNLNFAGSRTLDPRITFTRTSSATHMGPDGLIKIAAANSPRFDHSYNSATGEIESLGLLIEEARANSVRRSQELDESSVWSRTNVGITTNATIAPDGNLSAEKLIDDTSVNTQHWLRIRCTGITTNTFVTASTFFKFDPTNLSARGLSLVVTDAETGGSTYSSIKIKTDGTFTVPTPNFPNTTGGLTPLSNGWYRAHVTFTNANISELSLRLQLIQDSNNSVFYTGDGSSGVFVWGAQLEVGSFPTSYIPTTASAVTRTVDNARIVGTNFSSWFNPNEGTLFASAISPFSGTRSFVGVTAVNNPSNFGNSRVDIRYLQSTTSASFFNNQLSIQRTSGFLLNNPKFITSYKLNNTAFGVNGDIISSSATVTPQADINTLQIGTFDNFSYHLCGTISQLTYYPKRLSNNILQNLTR